MRYPLLLSLTLLAGCASLPDPYGGVEEPRVEGVQRPATDPYEPRVPGPESRQMRNAAVVALADNAEGAFEQGDLARAASTLERAIGIDPGDAGAWLMLGWVRLAQAQYDQAQALAGRASGLQPTLAQRCLADALRQAARAGRGGWPQALEPYHLSVSRCTPRPA